MPLYYVNKRAQTNGDHEVHSDSCFYISKIKEKEFLGLFDNCVEAVAKAKLIYSRANGCAFCSPACHTG